LHERAGNKQVLHMHGELLKVRCTHSGKVFYWHEDLSIEDRCHCCQLAAQLRPHVVWFGEVPLGMKEIYQALAKADFFIAIGTSVHVCPAASFMREARLAGAYTMELNLEPSQKENQFHEKHYGQVSDVVPHFVHKFLVGGEVARADHDLPKNLSC
jgi:NAD-dependent deacetylase